MEIISKEEFDKLPARRCKFSPIRNFLEQLDVYQVLVISKNEWPQKTKPNAMIQQSYRKGRSEKNFTVRALADDKGWAVLRIK